MATSRIKKIYDGGHHNSAKKNHQFMARTQNGKIGSGMVIRSSANHHNAPTSGSFQVVSNSNYVVSNDLN